MSTQAETTRLVLNRIFHPSDFSPASAVAFAHALKLALITRATLRLMHVAADEEDMHWSDFPGVRATLARWGLLPEASPREAVGQLGLDIGKILCSRADPWVRCCTILMCTLPIWSYSPRINVPGWHAGCTGRWRNPWHAMQGR